LWHGIRKSTAPEKGEALLALFLGQVGVLHPDEGTAEIYGTIAASLERKGAKIPVNDIWIAAAALECGLPLATSDSHFQRVDGLQVLLWQVNGATGVRFLLCTHEALAYKRK
jgi:predicted nucleic acid-binding protein